jgi:hypothetical protein
VLALCALVCLLPSRTWLGNLGSSLLGVWGGGGPAVVVRPTALRLLLAVVLSLLRCHSPLLRIVFAPHGDVGSDLCFALPPACTREG